MKLRTKIQLLASVVVVVFVSLTNVAIYMFYENQSFQSEAERVLNQTDAMSQAVSTVPYDELILVNVIQSYIPTAGMIRLINEDQESFHTFTTDESFSSIPTSFTDSQSAQTMTTDDQERYVIASKPLIWEDGEIVTLQVVERLYGLEENMALLRYILIVASIIAILPAIVGGFLLAAIIVKPVQRLSETMVQVEAEGNFQKLNEQNVTKDELGQLTVAFNKMMERLHRQFKQQEQFVSDASHELRTPLTVIDGYAKLLLRRDIDRSSPLFKESLLAISSETKQMQHLTEQLLILAKDDEQLHVEKSTFNITHLLEEVRDRFQVATDRQIKQIDERFKQTVYADREKVKQVLYILVDNALKYSEGDIEFVVDRKKDMVYVLVRDYGVGIDEQEIAYIFDRFYQIDAGRDRQTTGVGLGLSIAKKLLEAQQATISVESEKGKSTTFTIGLPAGEGSGNDE
ncbi:hypothetical protein DH09_02895 [Bacillaceae bacterium JMAK1]|nr:hypothetical protein DH09_02895 [Bacillaceae bacterium JMAK1]